MSSFNGNGDSPNEPNEGRSWGRIFIGLTEKDLDGVEHARQTNWTEKDEAAYLGRVKEKAETMAKDILEKAAREAADIKAKAEEAGYAEGMGKAEAELEEFRAAVAESSNAVLTAIKEESSTLYNVWREDLTVLLRLAVEKVVGFMVDSSRRKLLESLYDQSVRSLESHRMLTVRVNPDDEPVLTDIIGMTQANYPGLQSWRVVSDHAIEPGGLILESESSLADNRIESRIRAVDAALAHLILPPEPPAAHIESPPAETSSARTEVASPAPAASPAAVEPADGVIGLSE